MLPSSRATPHGAPPDPHAGGLSAAGGMGQGGGVGKKPATPAPPAGSVARSCPRVPPGMAPACGHGDLEQLRRELKDWQAELHELSQELSDKHAVVDAASAAQKVSETERQRRERHRHEAQRLESLGALAGGLAHQFNNLLTVITGHVGLAAAEAVPGSNQAHSLEEVRGAAQRAAVLCRQMLDAAGHSVAARRPLHPEPLCEDALAGVRGSAGGECRLEFRPALLRLPEVRGVAAQLQQAVSAVVQNAVDAVGERAGSVCVALHDQFVDHMHAAVLTTPLRPGRYVCVEVQDDGPGIEPATLVRIFDPFFSTKGLGRGLGLAAAAGILRAHGGAIAVDSRPGEGATFRLFLPVLEASAAGN